MRRIAVREMARDHHISNDDRLDTRRPQLPIVAATAFGIRQRLVRFASPLESTGEEPAPTSGW